MSKTTRLRPSQGGKLRGPMLPHKPDQMEAARQQIDGVGYTGQFLEWPPITTTEDERRLQPLYRDLIKGILVPPEDVSAKAIDLLYGGEPVIPDEKAELERLTAQRTALAKDASRYSKFIDAGRRYRDRFKRGEMIVRAAALLLQGEDPVMRVPCFMPAVTGPYMADNIVHAESGLRAELITLEQSRSASGCRLVLDEDRRLVHVDDDWRVYGKEWNDDVRFWRESTGLRFWGDTRESYKQGLARISKELEPIQKRIDELSKPKSEVFIKPMNAQFQSNLAEFKRAQTMFKIGCPVVVHGQCGVIEAIIVDDPFDGCGPIVSLDVKHPNDDLTYRYASSEVQPAPSTPTTVGKWSYKDLDFTITADKQVVFRYLRKLQVEYQAARTAIAKVPPTEKAWADAVNEMRDLGNKAFVVIEECIQPEVGFSVDAYGFLQHAEITL